MKHQHVSVHDQPFGGYFVFGLLLQFDVLFPVTGVLMKRGRLKAVSG
jgi:hypothetical protein